MIFMAFGGDRCLEKIGVEADFPRVWGIAIGSILGYPFLKTIENAGGLAFAHSPPVGPSDV
ncbi:MAG: hypothetical protein ACREKE_02870 [bacterium]